MRKTIFSALVLSGVIANAQNDYYGRMGLNTETPRATLEVKATSHNKAQGILLPTVTETVKNKWAKDNAKGLVAGTVIWNETKKCLDYFDGTTWQCTNGTKTNTHGTPWYDVANLNITALAFAGEYKEGKVFTTANTVKFKLKNNGTEPFSNLNLTNAVTVTNGSATITGEEDRGFDTRVKFPSFGKRGASQRRGVRSLWTRGQPKNIPLPPSKGEYRNANTIRKLRTHAKSPFEGGRGMLKIQKGRIQYAPILNLLTF